MCEDDEPLDGEPAPALTAADRELVERLEATAADRWGERYAISVRRWSDGTAQVYAEHISGLSPEGHRVKERLMPDGEGNFGLDVVVETRSESVSSEVLEYPVDGAGHSNTG